MQVDKDGSEKREWKETVKEKAMWILLLLCCLNILIWFVMVAYTVHQVSSISNEVERMSSGLNHKPSSAALAQSKQETEERFILRLTDELKVVRKENNVEAKSLREMALKLDDRLVHLETLHKNFNRFWRSLVEKVLSGRKRVKPSSYKTFNIWNVSDPNYNHYRSRNYNVEHGSGEDEYSLGGGEEALEAGSGESSDSNSGNSNGEVKRISIMMQQPSDNLEEIKSGLPLPQEIVGLLACRQGPQGANGRNGLDGLPGTKGSTGEKGEAGLPGPQGVKGADGESGLPGAKGERGALGLTGAAGQPGEKGSVGHPGSTGPTGERGQKGDTGSPGHAGVKGDRGRYGFPGIPGAVGVKGAQGDRGLDGAPGLPGSAGKDGASVIVPDLFPSEVISGVLNTTLTLMEKGGLRGPPGLDGTPGTDGIPGTNGIDGTPGTPGTDGIPGTNGVDGTPGIPGRNASDFLTKRAVKSLITEFIGGDEIFIANGKFYTLHRERKDWHNARNYCLDKNRDLAALTGSQEDFQRFIVNLNSLADVPNHLWVGGKRQDSESLVWNGVAHIADHLWHSGEPNNYGGGEDCTELKKESGVLRLNDVLCGAVREFICQLPSN